MDIDRFVGAGAAAFGSGGLYVQYITEFASLALVIANVALAIGGLYLLVLRIRKLKREEREELAAKSQRLKDASRRERT